METNLQKKSQRYVHIVLRGHHIMGVYASARLAAEGLSIQKQKYLNLIEQNTGVDWSNEAYDELSKWYVARYAIN